MCRSPNVSASAGALLLCRYEVQSNSDDAGSGIPQRAGRAGCLSSKPASGAERTISLQSFHIQQLKVIIHSQGWRNAQTSGAVPIFKHISQLNLWGTVTKTARFLTNQALCLSTLEKQLEFLKYDSSLLETPLFAIAVKYLNMYAHEMFRIL